MEDKDQLILQCQYRGCWWRQGISRYGIDLVFPEYFELITKSVKIYPYLNQIIYLMLWENFLEGILNKLCVNNWLTLDLWVSQWVAEHWQNTLHLGPLKHINLNSKFHN